MNQYVTGAIIKNLREKNHLTQAELANKHMKGDCEWASEKGFVDRK